MERFPCNVCQVQDLFQKILLEQLNIDEDQLIYMAIFFIMLSVNSCLFKIKKIQLYFDILSRNHPTSVASMQVKFFLVIQRPKALFKAYWRIFCKKRSE